MAGGEVSHGIKLFYQLGKAVPDFYLFSTKSSFTSQVGFWM